MMPVRLTVHLLAAAAWLLLNLSSFIAGPFLTLLGVLVVFCAAHQEWRNVAILVILGGIVYGTSTAAKHSGTESGRILTRSFLRNLQLQKSFRCCCVCSPEPFCEILRFVLFFSFVGI